MTLEDGGMSVTKPWQDAAAGKEGRDQVNAELCDEVLNANLAAIRRYAAAAGTGPKCNYERKRGTEQECARELWIVQPIATVQGVAADFSYREIISCLLHLPMLMDDRFVREYQLARIEQ